MHFFWVHFYRWIHCLLSNVVQCSLSSSFQDFSFSCLSKKRTKIAALLDPNSYVISYAFCLCSCATHAGWNNRLRALLSSSQHHFYMKVKQNTTLRKTLPHWGCWHGKIWNSCSLNSVFWVVARIKMMQFKNPQVCRIKVVIFIHLCWGLANNYTRSVFHYNGCSDAPSLQYSVWD